MTRTEGGRRSAARRIGLLALPLLVAGTFAACGDDGDAPDATADVPSGISELDDLAQSCHDGDMGDCDEIFDTINDNAEDYQDNVEAATEYIEFGDTCAGRQESGTQRYCEDAF